MEWYLRNLFYVWINFFFHVQFLINPFKVGDYVLKCVIYKVFTEVVYTESKLSID